MEERRDLAVRVGERNAGSAAFERESFDSPCEAFDSALGDDVIEEGLSTCPADVVVVEAVDVVVAVEEEVIVEVVNVVDVVEGQEKEEVIADLGGSGDLSCFACNDAVE